MSFCAVARSEVGNDSSDVVERGATVVKQWSNEALERRQWSSEAWNDNFAK